MNRHAKGRNRQQAQLEEAGVELQTVLALDAEAFVAATRAATTLRALAERAQQAAQELQVIGVQGSRRAQVGHRCAVELTAAIVRMAEQREAAQAA